MHDLYVATKTISIEIDAYELLVRERRDPKTGSDRGGLAGGDGGISGQGSRAPAQTRP
jgi:hypothetical protein